MKVLSLFDGCGMAYQALKDIGITVSSYKASEIDKYAIQVAMKNHPDIIQLGDVTKVNGLELGDIDLLVGGSPCTQLSIAGNREGLLGEQSKLFYEFVRILKEVKPRYFLLENVASMSKDNRAGMSKVIGVEATIINSSLLTAQNRKRLYRFGERQEDGTYKQVEITQPEDRGIVIKDILEENVDEKYYMDDSVLEKFLSTRREIVSDSGIKQLNNPTHSNNRLYSDEGKSPTLNTMQGGNRQPKIIQKVGDRDKNNWGVYEDKSYCLPTNPMSDRGQMVLEKERIRKLTPLECMRLQGLPDGYCSNIVSNSQQYKMIGNGFTVPVIAHIFSFIK